MNSTERLLDSIRRTVQKTGGKAPALAHESSVNRPIIGGKKHFLAPGGMSTCAGILISETEIFIAVAGGSGSGWVLNSWARILMPRDLSIEGEGFPLFLKKSLIDVLGRTKKLSIWTSVPSRSLKLRYLTIPDLPHGKIPNAAYWSLSKEVRVNTGEEVFDFDMLGEFHEDGKKKQRILAYAAPMAEINLLQKVFLKAGFPLTGITASPFALQNFFRKGLLSPSEQPITLAGVDRDYTEISCISGKNILLNRSIRTGGASLLEDLISGEEEGGAVDSLTKLLEQGGALLDAKFDLVENPAERLVGKIARTGDYCSNLYNDNHPMGTTYFFGYPDDSQRFIDFARKNMGTDVERFDPLSNAIFQEDGTKTKNGAERRGVIPAFGLALSDNAHTPNFLYTYQEKNARKKFRRLNLIVLFGFLASMGACLGVFAWQQSIISDEKARTAELTASLDRYDVKVSRDMITEIIAQATKKAEKKKTYAESLISLAVVGEICSITPNNISILFLEATFGNAPTLGGEEGQKKERTGSKNSKNSGKDKRLVLRGMVDAEHTALDSELTQYILRLGDSPLFGDISLAGKEMVNTEQGSLLKFTAEMEIL